MTAPEIPTQRPICAACEHPITATVYVVARRPAREGEEDPALLCSTACLTEHAEREEWADTEHYQRRVREGRDELARLRGRR